MRLASTVEFLTRSDGLKPLQQAYGFEFVLGNVVGMDTGAIYNALGRQSEFDVGVVFATDGRISAFDFTTGMTAAFSLAICSRLSSVTPR
jgi:osmoprotectant transport system substrate-binding protein